MQGGANRMSKKEWLKNRINRVKQEMKNETNNKKKQRLNKYKCQLEIKLRDIKE